MVVVGTREMVRASRCIVLKVFAIVVVGVVAALAVFALVVSQRPSAYRVERRLELAAPRDAVFGVVNDLHSFSAVLVVFGKPWEKLDENADKTFAGPAAGVGQSLAFRGNAQMGTGTMSIEESVATEKVRVKLDLVKPMKSTMMSTVTLAATSTGSQVTWTMEGEHNFVGKAMGLFIDMDQAMAADIDKGLAQLRLATETKPAGDHIVSTRTNANEPSESAARP